MLHPATYEIWPRATVAVAVLAVVLPIIVAIDRRQARQRGERPAATTRWILAALVIAVLACVGIAVIASMAEGPPSLVGRGW